MERIYLVTTQVPETESTYTNYIEAHSAQEAVDKVRVFDPAPVIEVSVIVKDWK